MLKNYRYTLGGLGCALLITLTSRFAHFYHTGVFPLRLLPPDPHDRAMFLLVSSILVAVGFIVDRHTRIIIAHEEEKRRVFTSAVAASQHILNNFLNNMLYFQQQAQASRALDEKTLELLNTVIHDAADQLKKLGEISEISEKNIRDTIYPK
jgi:signal transduction histidine kinase